MLTKVFIGSILTLGVLLAGIALADKPTKDCCSAKLACCNPQIACCTADVKPGCCEKGMKCFAKAGVLHR